MNEFLKQMSESPAAFGGAVLIVMISVAWGGWTILSIIFESRPTTASNDPFEPNRRQQLRDANRVYRYFEPLVEEISNIIKQARRESGLAQLERCLISSGEKLPWKASEYLGFRTVEGGLVALAACGILSLLMTPAIGVAAVCLLLPSYVVLSEYSIQAKSKARTEVIKRRLPYAVDLIALMMQAGGGFNECVSSFVDESKGHPLAEELKVVLEQIELGRSQQESLDAFSNRVKDPDVTELVFAINKGQELGTPISSILREQANQMRLKRSQWGEKAAAEAGVKVIFPGMLIVVACLIVVLAPFALPILDSI